MTHNQELFVKAFIDDLNATEAAVRAGYDKADAFNTGEKLLGNRTIFNAICQGMADRSAGNKAYSTFSLNTLVEIDKMCLSDIMNNGWMLKPKSEWPEIWHRFPPVVTTQQTESGKTIVSRFRGIDKLVNLELLGSHIEVKAFEIPM